MRIRLASALLTIVACTAGTAAHAAPSPSAAKPAAKPATTAAPGTQATATQALQTAVEEFYRFHLAHDMSFTAAAVTLRERWLDPALLALCRAYFKRPSGPDSELVVDGDPFSDSTEYPTAFHVDAVNATGATAAADVSFTGAQSSKSKVRLQLVFADGSWRIANLIYDADGPTMRDLLIGHR